MERVLSLPELLENILLHLDMTTLLACVQRVSKTWNHAIACSPALQQKLFFHPITAEQLPFFREQLMGEVEMACQENFGPELTKLVLNPLLVNKFGSCFFDFGPTFGYLRGADSFHTLPWSPNHRKLISTHLPGRRHVRYKIEIPKELDEASYRLEETCRARFTTRGASWRRMLVSQPAPPSIGYLSLEGCRQSPLFFEKVLGEAFIPAATTKGVQMGQLYDMVQYFAGHHTFRIAKFRVSWELPPPCGEPHLRELMEQILRQTTLLVLIEFTGCFSGTDPQNVADFDSDFRCEEFFLSDIIVKQSEPIHLGGDRENKGTVIASFIGPPLYGMNQRRHRRDRVIS